MQQVICELITYVVLCHVVRDRKGEADETSHMDAVSFWSESFEAAGLKVEVLEGIDHKVFIKVSNACTRRSGENLFTVNLGFYSSSCS